MRCIAVDIRHDFSILLSLLSKLGHFCLDKRYHHSPRQLFFLPFAAGGDEEKESTKDMTEEGQQQKAWKQAIEHVAWFVSLLQQPCESEFARAARQAITIALTQEEYDSWYSDLLAFARESFQDKVRRKYEADKQAQWYARFEGNTEEELEILGSERLRANIMRILELVKEKLPFRYQQIIHSFKRIEFVTPEALIEDWTGYRPAYQMAGLRANSNGYFTVDGGRPESEEFWHFARTFLHECGHNVHGHFRLAICAGETAAERERVARAYAETVLAEMVSDLEENQEMYISSGLTASIDG